MGTPRERRPGRVDGIEGRQGRAAGTEAALKAAARRTFARLGYFNSKISDITSEAGRSAGSFYNYFQNKEDLLEALARDFLTDLETRQRTTPDHPRDLSFEHLRTHVAQYWHSYREHLPEMVAIFQASMASPAFFERWRELRDVDFDEFDELSALLGKENPSVVVSATLSMLEFFCYIWQAAGGDPPGTELADDDAIDTLTGLLLYGLRGRPS
jgi:AcrR family transcriptional regulator